MMKGVIEEYQVHLGGEGDVVLFQVLHEQLGHNLRGGDLSVDFILTREIVTKDEIPENFDGDPNLEMLHHHLLDQVIEVITILIIDEPITEHPGFLMAPQLNEVLLGMSQPWLGH